jgi:hypothetical protein
MTDQEVYERVHDVMFDYLTYRRGRQAPYARRAQ